MSKGRVTNITNANGTNSLMQIIWAHEVTSSSSKTSMLGIYGGRTNVKVLSTASDILYLLSLLLRMQKKSLQFWMRSDCAREQRVTNDEGRSAENNG